MSRPGIRHIHLRFVPSTAIYYLDMVVRRRRQPDGAVDPHRPRMRVRDRGQVIRNDQSVVSMAVSTAPRHLITSADSYVLHGTQAYSGPIVSGFLQPVGQAVLQIWPRVEQDQEVAAYQPGPECGAAGAQEHEAGADAVWDQVQSAERKLQQARESLQAEWGMQRAEQHRDMLGALGFTRSATRPEISAAAAAVIDAEWWAD